MSDVNAPYTYNDAKKFIESGFKTLTMMRNNQDLDITDESLMGTYHGLSVVAQAYPDVLPLFVKKADAFVAHDQSQLLPHILHDLVQIGRDYPSVAPEVIAIGWRAITVYNNAAEKRKAETMTDMIQGLARCAEDGASAELYIKTGLATLPALVNESGHATYHALIQLFHAAKDSDLPTKPVMDAARAILPAATDRSPSGALKIIETLAHMGSHYPQEMPWVIEEADIVFKRAGTSKDSYDQEVVRRTIEQMLRRAQGGDELQRNIIRLGENTLRNAEKKGTYTTIELFKLLLKETDNHPSALPSVIGTAFETLLPALEGDSVGRLMPKLVKAAMTSDDARAAFAEGALHMVQNGAATLHSAIAHVLDALKTVTGAKDKRNVLGQSFAFSTLGHGAQARETWYVPHKGDTLIISGNSITNIDDLTAKNSAEMAQGSGSDQAKRSLTKSMMVAQIAQTARTVFAEQITPDQGRREIRRETGLRFETLR